MKSFDAQNTPDDVPPNNVGEALRRMSGVDLTSMDGIDTNTALKILAEIGTDMNRWKTAKHLPLGSACLPEQRLVVVRY